MLTCVAAKAALFLLFLFFQASFIKSFRLIGGISVKNVTKFLSAMPKVELHVHMDGAMRPSTLWELAQRKGFPQMQPEVTNEIELKDFLIMKDDGNLPEFLQKFQFMLPQVADDLTAIRRVAMELCQDKAKEGVIYFETRYAPQLLLRSGATDGLDAIVEAVNEGLKEGSETYNVTGRSILSCMRMPNGGKWSMQLAKLAHKYRAAGVVGIDLAGDESVVNASHPDDSRHVEAFEFAFNNSIHRTVHAGEAGPASNVKEAIEVLRAERIGHGYRVLDDDDVYRLAKQKKVHFEECPTSSVKTGAVDVKSRGWRSHPLARFVSDGVSISLNTDDPTVTGSDLVHEYRLTSNATAGIGLQLSDLAKIVGDSLDASFASEKEKQALRKLAAQKLAAAIEFANSGVDERSQNRILFYTGLYFALSLLKMVHF